MLRELVVVPSPRTAQQVKLEAVQSASSLRAQIAHPPRLSIRPLGLHVYERACEKNRDLGPRKFIQMKFRKKESSQLEKANASFKYLYYCPREEAHYVLQNSVITITCST